MRAVMDSTVELAIVDLVVIIFIAGLLATIIGVGWRINRQGVQHNRDEIETAREDLRELYYRLFGSDQSNLSIGDVGVLEEQIVETDEELTDQLTSLEEKIDINQEELYGEFQDMRGLLTDLVHHLDSLDTLKDFEGRKVLDTNSSDD